METQGDKVLVRSIKIVVCLYHVCEQEHTVYLLYFYIVQCKHVYVKSTGASLSPSLSPSLQVMDLMGQAMEQFGLMMCSVEVVRKVCPSVFTVAGESITVTTMKMPQ